MVKLTDNRVVTLGGNNLTFVADQGETFEIASDPGSDVLISGFTINFWFKYSIL
jgi:hypothetical protein